MASASGGSALDVRTGETAARIPRDYKGEKAAHILFVEGV